MDSTDDNAVTNEPEVRRTRSGRAVRPPPTQVQKTARKTRKKMVLVEVEVSEEEDEEHVNISVGDHEVESSFIAESTNESVSNSNQHEPESVAEELKYQMETPTVEDSNSVQNELNNSVSFQDEGDSSTDQNDSRSVQFGSTNENDSEQPFPFAEQNSTDTDAPETQNNDSVTEEESKDERKQAFDVSVLNNDSQTQCKPDEKEAEGNENTSESMETEDIETAKMYDNIATEEELKADVDKDSKGDVIAKNESEMFVEADEQIDRDDGLKPMDVVEENGTAKVSTEEEKMEESSVEKPKKQAIDPETEVISEDELPTVVAAKVPETEEVSDEELPGPKLAELPADTEVVSEDELPSVKKESASTKRKLEENEYDPGSPTSESEQSAAKKPALDATGSGAGSTTLSADTKEKATKPRKLPELDKYWKAVNDDPTDFTGWTYLLQYVDQENDMEAAREAYDAFLSHYPYCYGYWRKYADYEKRKGNKKKCEEVFERGLKAIPLSVDLWLHYLNYTRTSHADDETHVRAQYERAIHQAGLEFRSDRLWDHYIKWEQDAKRYQHVTALYDRLLATPTQGYTNHFDNFQEHVASHPPNKILEVDEFLALRKEVRHMLKHDVPNPDAAANADVPPGETDTQDSLKSDEETTAIRERIVSIRRKIHKSTVNAVTARWNFEEGIKRPYFHVKPLERCQLKNWKEYLDFEIEQGDQERIIVLFERCLIACALYEEFWLRFVHYLEGLNEVEVRGRVRDVYERACTIHHLNKPSLHLQWAMFEECALNYTRAAEILVNLEKSVPNLLQVAYRRINLERRRGDYEKCSQLYEHYINNSKSKMISSNLAIKYARFCLKICKNLEKSFEILNKAIEKDGTNARLYLQLIDLTLQKDGVSEAEVLEYIDQFLSRDVADLDQKVLFAQRKLEFLEDFGSDIQSVQKAYDDYQKYCKLNKEKKKKDDGKSIEASGKKTKEAAAAAATAASQSSSYSSYSAGGGQYGGSGGGGSGGGGGGAAAAAAAAAAASQGQYGQYGGGSGGGGGGGAAQGYAGQYGQQYSQGDQYQYPNWQYSQSGYGGYNQWGSYGNYY